MEHYRITINDYPVGSYRIFKEGSFFIDRRFYKKARAEHFAKIMAIHGEVKISLYRKVPFKDSHVYDEVEA